MTKKTAREKSKNLLKKRLKQKYSKEKLDFSKKYPKADIFLKEKQLELGKIREHSAKIIGAGAFTGRLMLSPTIPSTELPPPSEIIEKLKLPGLGESEEGVDNKKLLLDNLNLVLPERPRPLEENEEKFVEQLIQNIVGVKAKANLEGEHLNTNFGYIGLEQHLRRFPSDTIQEHGEGQAIRNGMAPGLGAWGYFASSRYQMTDNLEEIEQWYCVVQTLYLPDWNTRQPYLKNWYKYRKVLILNTQNGNAVVSAVADSGPAIWTGKSFGGSPEVMDFLGGSKYTKGKVLLLFIDDPDNQVPLGPVDYSKIKLANVIKKV